MRNRRYTYPDDWKQISRQVREVAGWKCEQCSAPHGVLIQRLKSNKAIWRKALDGDHYGWTKAKKCVVSVHHIGVDNPDGSPGDGTDKMDCRPENLIALCARCHLLADIKIAVKHARQTKLASQRQLALAAGQIELF